MNTFLLTPLLLCFCIIYVWIGTKSANNNTNNKDYFLMGRRLGFIPLCLTFFATMLGGGTLIVAAQSAYELGWIVLLYPIGNSLGFIALASGFGKRLRELNIETISEIFAKRYGSYKLRSYSAVIMSISLYFILVGQGIAIKSFFITLGIENIMVFITFWACFVAYTTLGGFEAVVKTDVIQALFIIIGLIFAYALSTPGQLPIESTSIDLNNVPWTGWLLMPLCYTLIGQYMGQRCFASKNTKIIAPAALLASFLVILCSGIAIYFGISAKAAGLDIANAGNILLTAVNAFTPTWLSLICSAVIIMAVASTADSLLSAISACLCNDLKSNVKNSVTTARLVTFTIGLSALCFIMLLNDVVSLLIFSYEMSISILFAPIIAAVYVDTPKKEAAITAMLTGAASFLLCKLSSVFIASEVITLLISGISFALIQTRSKLTVLTHMP